MESTIDKTLDHVMFLARHFKKSDFQSVILVVLLELGIPTQREGFTYLRTVIAQRYDHPLLTMKELYPTVGVSCDTDAGYFQVEQAIRAAINAAWKNRDDKHWDYYFPADESGKMKKPSNTEFITRIACILELWRGCCEEVSYAGK